VIATILRALVILLDADHCSAWVTSHGALVCAEVQLEAACAVEGWHVVHQGISVCSRGCEGGKPTS
jgi:hypothetical protein